MARTHQYLSAFSLCLLISALPPSSVQASGNHAGKSEAVVQKKVFNIDIGGFIRLAIPMAMLEQSLLVPIDGGVMMVFPEGGSFDASVLPDTQTGFPGADMRRAPAYMFGQGSGSDSGDAFQKEMQKMGRIFIQTYQPISPIRKFDMEGGKGYWLEGTENSLIILVSQEIRDHLVVISAKGIPGEKIINWVSQGAGTAGRLN